MMSLLTIYSVVAQIQYKQQDNEVAAFIHWHLARVVGFQVCDNWWEHNPNKVLCLQLCKILWDYTIVINHK